MSMSTGLSIGELLERNAWLYPERTAFVDEHRGLSHAEYLIRCRRLADACYRVGARRQDRVGVLSMNSVSFAEAYGACEVSGLITATVNFRLAAPEMAYILKEAAPIVVIFEERYAALLAGIREPLTSVAAWICIGSPPAWATSYEEFLESGGVEGPPIRATQDDIAHLIFTSGTTGRPKGCMLGHRESLVKAQFHASDMSIDIDDKVLIVMPLFHVGARGVASAAQWRGASVFLRRQFEPADFIRTVAAERISIGHLAPTMVQSVLEDETVGRFDLSSLKAVCYAAAPMPMPVLRRGLELLGNVFHQSYGQTEGAVSSLQRWQHRPDGDERDLRRLRSVGQPYPGVEVRIVDDAGVDLPVNTPGEIVYRGGSMFRGYWNDMVATLNTLREGWVHSGDIGEFDEDGFLYIVDRRKDMIISGGENIYSREVEDALGQHPAVSECAVIGVRHEKWGETVRAVVVLRAGSDVSEEALIDFCKQLIASYKKPTSVVFCADLPKINGKINKAEIRVLYGS